ncbi:glutathione S-transferase Mu 1-like [Argiope bruennichi]|uniref:glutathione S-transferase Mu 1-like n=1 Tax=Argiope bruennichi TaxID=94029 RepID=UPI002494DBA9|nr:glutathione S-transferase Mu 1-like [Argiope bruennichi]
MAKPLLGYWDVRGIAEPIRYLLHYKKVDFDEKRYVIAGDEWTNEKFNLGFDFPNLPYYKEGDFKLTQSLAIMRYLARKHGLAGETDEEKDRVALAEQQSRDFRAVLRAFVGDDGYETRKDEFLKNTVSVLFRQWENFLGDRKFLAGDNLTYVDFMLYENLDFYRLFHASILDDFASLKAYFSRIKDLPEMQKYLNSSRFKAWPIFAPAAKFGGGGKPPKHLKA